VRIASGVAPEEAILYHAWEPSRKGRFAGPCPMMRKRMRAKL